ncbi:MAG TPA: branched-chain amino acid ABC transporter permease [Acidimicrobiales bacterium]|nr:branched-chain amino acid ABC transporter permease [Acidimicrobiales bacterium]
MGQALVSGVVVGGIFGLLAVGIVLVYKGARVINFAQAEIGTFCLYVAYFVVDGDDGLGLPWIVGALAALVIGGLVSFAFERLVVRRMFGAERLSVAVATIGLLLLLFSLELKFFGSAPRFLAKPIDGLGPKVFGIFVSPTQLLALVAALAIGFGLTAFLQRTDFGLGVLAAAEDANAARLVGVPLARVSAFSWTVAGALSVIAAVLVEPTIGIFFPGVMTLLFVPALAAALVGGLSSIAGAFVGGLVIGVVDQVVRYLFLGSSIAAPEIIASFLVILVVLLIRPQGLLARRAA